MYCVIAGDIINSKEMGFEVREMVTQRIKDTFNLINTDYMPYILAGFGLVRGDAFEGVLLSQNQAPKIIQEIIKALYRVERTKIRISIVVGQLTIISSDRNETDGPAFYKALDNINKMKEQQSDHWLQVSFDTQSVAQLLIESLIMLVTALTKGWTDKQREIVWAMEELYEDTGLVSKRLGISKSVVIKQLKAANYEAYHQAWSNLEQYLIDFEDWSIDASLKYEPGYSAYYSAAIRKNRQRDDNSALPLINKSLELAKEEFGEDSPQLADIYNLLSEVLIDMESYTEAEEAINTSLRLQKPLSQNRLEYANTLNSMGRLQELFYQNLDEAMRFYEDAKQIALNTVGVYHPLISGCNSDIAGIFYEKGKYQKALEYYVAALEISRKYFNSNPINVAASLHNIALCYYEMGEIENALNSVEEALEICRKNLPHNHKDILNTENLLQKIKNKRS